MSYKMRELSKPVIDTELPPKLRKRFLALFDKIYNLAKLDLPSDLAAVLLHQHIEIEVTARPILARIVKSDKGWSLLETTCRLKNASFQESIQLLIEANPHALLWGRLDPGTNDYCATIHWIGTNRWNCKSLVWIVERYPWVFEHKACQKRPPHLEMVKFWADGLCESEKVQKFYELYPQGLREKERSSSTVGLYPLAISLDGSEEPDADIFIWMAEQFPQAVYHKPRRGYTVLHAVCISLAAKENEYQYEPFKCTDNTAKICRFLICKHPDLVRQKIHRNGYLPIHLLATCFNRPLVREMAVLLLKEYPECVDVKAGEWRPELSTVPFLQQVHPLILEELEVDEEVSLLAEIAQNMAKAANLSANRVISTSEPNGSPFNASLMNAVSEVFSSWANLRVTEVLTAEKERIKAHIIDTCRLFDGDDVPDEMVDEDDFWGNDLAPDSESEEDDDVSNESAESDDEEGSDEDRMSDFDEEDDLDEDTTSDFDNEDI